MTPEFNGMGSAMLWVRIMEDAFGLATAGAGAAARYCLVRMREGRTERIEADTLEEFLQECGYAASTARSYACRVRCFLRFNGFCTMIPGPGRAAAFLEHGRIMGNGDAWQRVNLAAIRTVFDRLLGCSLTEGIEYAPPPARLPPPRPYTIRGLLDACRNLDDRLAVHLLRVENLRPFQIVSLRRRDIGRGEIRVLRRRGRRVWREAIRLSPGTAALLRDLCETRSGPAPPDPDARLFCLTVRGFEKRIDRLSARAGAALCPEIIRRHGGTLIPRPFAEAA